MSIELKGLLAAVVAGLIVVGAAFGIAGIVRSLTSAPVAIGSGESHAASAPTLSVGIGANNQAALVKAGALIYSDSCASCHGAQGEGNIGPDLQNTDQSTAKIVSKVTNGIPGSMPAFGRKYSAQQIAGIAAYVRSLK